MASDKFRLVKILLGAALFAAVAPAHADEFTRTALQLVSTQWVNCAKEGDQCKPSTSNLVTTRYGVGSDYTYFVTKGVSNIPCKNFWGDPSKGTNKTCAYITDNLLAVPDDSTFTKAADENGVVSTPMAGLFWVRYGKGNSWAYTLVEGGEQDLPCTNGYFGFDPVKGTTKICELGAAYSLEDGDIVECATEGRTCDLNIGNPVLARYGIGRGYDFRFVHQAENKIPCTNNYFGVDPAKGNNKRCYVQQIKPASVTTFGKWTEVISCQGKGCPITHQLQVGTERSNSWTTTTEWSETVTTSMEAGFEIEGVGAKVSTSVATSYSESFGFTSALSHSITETYTAQCDPSGEYDSRSLYQFSTSTGESCLENGTCGGSTFTAQYICVGNPPAGYKGPACVPGYCANELCTVCTEN
ncbi:MAG: hypothetical protein Tsb002_35560 [Wenzhouxiangellaceae bacterium]